MAGIDTREADTGRYIIEADNSHRANVVMLGTDISKRFFAGVDPIGKSLYIDGEEFEVIGVSKELGTVFGQSQDDFVLMPVETYQKLYGTQESMDIAVQAIGQTSWRQPRMKPAC